MSESSEPAQPVESIRGSWIAWTAAVVGGPAVAMFALAFRGLGEAGGPMGLMVGFVLFVSFVTHIAVSVVLAQKISRRRDPDARTGAIAGLAIGFIFGGWAAMFAVLFVGCLGAMALG